MVRAADGVVNEMAKIRALDLAKELNVEVAELQAVAQDCGVVVSGPTSMLTPEEREKLAEAVKKGGKKPAASKRGARTLTLNKPMVAGARTAASASAGRGQTVKVEVRRKIAPKRTLTAPKPGAATATPATTATRKTESPAARAAKAVETRQAEAAKAAREAKAAKPRKTVLPGPTAASSTKSAVGAASSGRQGAATSGARATRSAGPRTTIRRGPTPAQIAAAKAPKSNLKDIEASIKKERAERGRTARPGGAAAAPGAPRRAPSVAVSPDVPAGGRRKPQPGGPQGGFKRRRLSPAEKAARRAYAEKRNLVLTEEEEERMARLARGHRRKTTAVTKDDAAFVVREVEIPDTIVVSELASRMAVKGADVVKKLFEMGVTTTVNESIDADTATLIVEEFGHKPKRINEAAVEDVLVDEGEDDPDKLQPRPPVVVVMGHVDHGKTSILDALRRANVAEGEAGGITQHIGAYMVKLESGDRVVFIDTPGHEAFTGLRARGAKLTDVAVLVVAADDGVKPQTVEAINHAKAAGVPIIVAVNKIDKEGADPEMVKRQMAEHEIVPEDWGGDTIFVNVSAKTGQGLDELLEMLALQTEILELRANPDRRGRGIVIESKLDRGRGPVATVLVQNGTFHKGDIVVVGTVMGRIRAIVDENGVQHRTAGPSIPFELLGLEAVPEAGQEIVVVENERQAREIVRYREEQLRKVSASTQKRVSMEDLFAAAKGEQAQEVNVIIKGDVTGSVEAMAEALAKLGTDEVRINVVHKGIGGITESDVMLASASNAIIIGFNVRPEAKAKKLAGQEGVDVRFYKVIYDAIDDMKAAMEGMLAPEEREKVIGSAEVREVFQVPKVGAVAGCYVTDGFVTRGAHVRVLRDGVLVYDGKLASLKRFKDDVREVKAGYECGIGVEKFNDVKAGDTFEFYVIEEVAAKL